MVAHAILYVCRCYLVVLYQCRLLLIVSTLMNVAIEPATTDTAIAEPAQIGPNPPQDVQVPRKVADVGKLPIGVKVCIKRREFVATPMIGHPKINRSFKWDGYTSWTQALDAARQWVESIQKTYEDMLIYNHLIFVLRLQ